MPSCFSEAEVVVVERLDGGKAGQAGQHLARAHLVARALIFGKSKRVWLSKGKNLQVENSHFMASFADGGGDPLHAEKFQP
jgi:hypothetical protein